MQPTAFLAICGAATAIAAPTSQAGAGHSGMNTTKPFEVDHLYMEMDSVWDTSYGITIKFSVTDTNTDTDTFCNKTDVHPDTVYACERDQTKWTFNYDFSKLSIEWAWAPG